MAKKRIIILGAGLAGLSAAWHLQKKGIDCLIFEKEAEAGGLCRSKNIDGFTFDYCGHLLHFKERYSFNLIKELLDDNLAEHKKSAWIYSHDRFTRYPFQANLYGLPTSIIKECLSGFIQTLNNGHSKRKNLRFSEWMTQNFGRGITKHFMAPYNAKFWTLPPQKLTCEWIDGFIPIPSLAEMIDGTIKESHRQFGYNARFWYPREGGMGNLPQALANQIHNIYTDCQIEEINLAKKQIKMTSGDEERFDYLISTVPLPEVAVLIKDLPKGIRPLFKKLKWNSIFNLNLGIEKNDSFKRHWIYFPQKNISFFRVGFFHNFSSSLAPTHKSSLYVEVSYSKYKPIDKNKITSRIKEDLIKTGILRAEDKICSEDSNDIKYGYPIYDIDCNHAREAILKYLASLNIIPCGRYGSWRYLSMEDVLLDGKAVAEGF